MTTHIDRLLTPCILEAHQYFPVTVITGPRQSGKTYLCKHLFPDYAYVNLEDIGLRAAATENPSGFLESQGKTVIIDEVQNVPQLLSMIQVKVDEDSERHYILTGSSNFSLLHNISQSLAGRSALFTLLPFSLKETGSKTEGFSIEKILLDGLYPRVITHSIPFELYYRSYYNTYVERDLRDLLKVKNILAFDKFMRLLASRIGSEFNAAALAREAGVSSVTVKEWVSILTTSYIAFPLRPYYTNLSKRMVKMPKIYFFDTGLACFLLGIDSEEKMRTHHMRGALFENLAICELFKERLNKGKEPRIYFYREASGLEVDAVVEQGSELQLYEIKSGETFHTDYTKNMKEMSAQISMPTSAHVIYNGEAIPPLALNIRDI